MSGVDIVMWLSLAVVHYGMCEVRLHGTGCTVGEDRTGVDDRLHCMDGIPRF
jgi:hypothetical protein